MTVNLPGVSTKKRISRQVARQTRQILKLKDLNESLERKNASLRKKYSRLNQKCKSIACSPKSRAQNYMKDWNKSKNPKIAQQLLFKNCLTKEIKASVCKNP